MKTPAFQFYPADWLKDPNLRRCTHAAKGVWIDLLCLMSECDERGILATNGHVWGDEEIALAVGGDKDVVMSCLAELTLKGVSNRESNGALSCRRMVRDEHKRKLCQEAGKRGGNPNLKPTLKGGLNGASKGHANRKPTPSTSTSSSDISPDESEDEKKKKPSDDGMDFAEWFRGSLPDSCRLSANWKTEWAQCYDKMIRLDKRTPEEIDAVCEWARKDLFWTKNFLTPMKLRQRQESSGLLYFDVLKAKMPTPKGVPGTAGNPYL